MLLATAGDKPGFETKPTTGTERRVRLNHPGRNIQNEAPNTQVLPGNTFVLKYLNSQFYTLVTIASVLIPEVLELYNHNFIIL